MPIDIYTGQPGNGKTALMMERLMQEVQKKERPIYAAGIDGLKPGIAELLDDPTKWNAKDENGDYIIPDGSLIFVDEAWKWFGHMLESASVKAPPHVLGLAEHRHRGIDFVWTTQSPAQLYPFARTLIADHYHVVRRFGTQFIDVYHWGELVEDVKSTAKRSLSQKTTRRLPKAIFDMYQSATLHTIKRRIPWRLYVLPLAILGALLAAYVAYTKLRPASVAGMTTGAASAAGAAPAASAGIAVHGSGEVEHPTRDAYIAAQVPRISSQPWSAELFDDRRAASDPQLFCMMSEPGTDAQGKHTDGSSCHCITEQATLYAVRQDECRRLARNGPAYNPYRSPERQGASSGGGNTAVAASVHDAGGDAGASSSGAVISGRMGQMGAESIGAGKASF